MKKSSVIDFFPKYEEITNEGLQLEIASKKEFITPVIEQVEEIPSEKGQYFTFQTIISRIMSPYTPYQKMLFYIEVGAGKTCTSILVHELKKAFKKDEMRRSLVLASNKTLLDQYKNQYTGTCPSLPADIDKKEKKKIVKENYEFRTIKTFVNNVIKPNADKNKKFLKDNYSNRLIIIDEGQDIKKQQKESLIKKGSDYYWMEKFFDIIENSSIIIMTGTPVVEDAYEIVALVNLLSDKKDRIEIGEKFYKKFYKTAKDGSVKLINKDLLVNLFRGKISFVKQMGTVAPKKYMKNESLKVPIDIYGCVMEQHQYEGYKNSINNKKDEAFYQLSKESSLFVFPDGSFGKDGWNEFVKFENKKYTFEKDFKSIIKDNLNQFSCKYDTIIKLIKENPNQCFFIFGDMFVNGGLIILEILLEMHGFSKLKSTKLGTKGKRFISVRTNTVEEEKAGIKTPVIADLLDYFSKERNVKGEYAQVIIGGEQISTGVTIKNLTNIIIVTPRWNPSSIEQPLARGIRPNSDKWLVKHKLDNTVKIYLLAALSPDEKELTTDLKIFQLADEKKKRNDPILELGKKSAIDCPLMYKRNVTNPEDNYKCTDMKPTGKDEQGIYTYTPSNIFETNFNLLYSSQIIEDIIEEFKDKLVENGHIDLNLYLKENDWTKSEQIIFFAVDKLIRVESPILVNKFGRECIIYHYNDFLFLQDSFVESEIDPFVMSYVENPAYHYTIDTDDIILYNGVSNHPAYPEVCDEDNLNDIQKIFLKESKDVKLQKNKYHSLFTELPFVEPKSKIRKFSNGRWEWVLDEKEIEDFYKVKKGNKEEKEIEPNEWGVVGINTKNNKFKILFTDNEKNRGKMCTSYKVHELFDVIVNLDILPPKNKIDLSDAGIKKAILSHPSFEKDPSFLEGKDPEVLRQYLTVLNTPVRKLCTFIKEEMKKKGILQIF